MLGYQEFRHSSKGRVIVDLITRSDSIAEMERRSRLHEPAVAAVDRAIIDDVGRLDDTERQHVGRAVRDVLRARGWRPTRRKRLNAGHTFASGAVYEQVHPETPPRALGTSAAMSPTDRQTAARRLLLAARRDPDSPIDTVDAFLADRKAMWSGA